MSGNILDQMERDRKKALNQGQKSIANPAVQANKAVQNAYNPAKVQNTVPKIGQAATKINNTVNKPVVGGVNNMNKAVNKGVNNINKPVNALNRNTAMQRSANVERQLDDLERFNRDMKRNSVADTAYNNAASNYNRQMANNAIMANRQTINNSPSNWSNTANNTMSEEERQLANIEAFNNEVVRPARGLNSNSPANLVGLAKTINNVPFKQNTPEGYDPNADYAALLDFAIKSGASADEVQRLQDLRNYKINSSPDYAQYKNDETALNAQTYINNNSMIDRLYDGQTDLYNQAVDLGLQNKLDALKLQGEQNKAKYDDIRSQAYSNARLSAIGNNEAMASMGLAGGLYSSPASGYSETSRMAQDNNLRSNISSAYRQEQERLEELQNLENEERRNAEAEKLSYLASMGDKKAQATLDKYYNDRSYEYQKGRDERADFESDRNYEFNVDRADRSDFESDRNYNYQKNTDDRNYNYQVGRDQRADFESDRNYGFNVDRAKRADFESDRNYDYTKSQDAINNSLAQQRINNSRSSGNSGSISGEPSISNEELAEILSNVDYENFSMEDIKKLSPYLKVIYGEELFNRIAGISR